MSQTQSVNRGSTPLDTLTSIPTYLLSNQKSKRECCHSMLGPVLGSTHATRIVAAIGIGSNQALDRHVESELH